MSAPTIREKAEAFDALVKMLQGHHEYIGDAIRYPKLFNLPPGAIPTDMKATREPIYKWELRCVGESNIEQALLAMLPSRAGGKRT